MMTGSAEQASSKDIWTVTMTELHSIIKEQLSCTQRTRMMLAGVGLPISM